MILALALTLSAGASGQNRFGAHRAQHLRLYGTINTYAAFDTRESLAGEEDFFYYLPKDVKLNSDGKDLNYSPSLRFAAITSRLGLDIVDYEFNGWKMMGKIEGDFYAGLNGSTGAAAFRLCQAFVSINKNGWGIKVGQAWHPMAADMPDIFSFNTGAPFGPYSKAPQAVLEYRAGKVLSFSAAALWQMQYCSAGPEGISANYIKYSCIPEFYLGVNLNIRNALIRVGADVLSIKPRKDNGVNKVKDRITTISPYIYAQYSYKDFSVKAKSIFAQAGEHLNLNGGYGISAVSSDGSYQYTPTMNSSSWISLKYGRKVQGSIFGGYAINLGTKDPVLMDDLYFSKNSYVNMLCMWRVTPGVTYNLGKFAVGLEYELTSVQYGDISKGMNLNNGLYLKGIHWVTNHRVQALVKYSF